MLELQNNGLGETTSDTCTGGAGCDLSNPDSCYFCYIASYPGPKGFQTENNANLNLPMVPKNLYQAIENGISMGAQFIELPGLYDEGTDWSRLKCYDKALEQGTPANCE
jgi:hypothetical protein